MSLLEKLPRKLRCQVFTYLLASDCVREPPNKYLVEHYKFEVRLLQVNRLISYDASEVLYRCNRFVKVNWNISTAIGFESMTNHEVPFFKSAKAFKHHVLEISIKPDDLRRKSFGGNIKTFLLLEDDIPKFARLLRILDLANFMGSHYKFDFRIPPLIQDQLPLVEQTRLLLPFEQLRGGAIVQRVTITGAVDMALAVRVKQAMTQKVAWLRGGAWEIHDLALSIKRQGDFAFKIGNADMALAKYGDSHTFEDTAFTQNSMMEGLEQDLHQTMIRLNTIIWADIALLMLSDMTKLEVGERQYKTVTKYTEHFLEAEKMNKDTKKVIVPAPVIARFYHLLGIAEFGLNHPNKAGKAFAKAYYLSAQPYYKQGWEAAKTWPNLCETARKNCFDAILANMPATPLPTPDMEEYMTPEVASEHWVMRELGFQGHIPYEDKIKPSVAIVFKTKPHPVLRHPVPRTAQVGHVKPEVLSKIVEQHKKEMNGPPVHGRLIVWVGLNMNQIGEESIMDDPAYATWVNALSGKMRGMWT